MIFDISLSAPIALEEVT